MIYVYLLVAALWAGSTGVAYFKGKIVAQEECDYENLRKQVQFERDLAAQYRKSFEEQLRLNQGYESALAEQEDRFEELQKELDAKEEGNVCVDEKFMKDLGNIK